MDHSKWDVIRFFALPICSLHLGQKCQHFPSFIVRTGPRKNGIQKVQKKHFLLSLNLILLAFPPERQEVLFKEEHYGPIPVKTETFRELWAPLVHTNFGREIHMDQNHWSKPFPGEIRVDQWSIRSSSKVSPYTGIGPWMALPNCSS